jgi:hypothetical protein
MLTVEPEEAVVASRGFLKSRLGTQKILHQQPISAANKKFGRVFS